jgi:DNA-binding Lrp family transcriptional regulator
LNRGPCGRDFFVPGSAAGAFGWTVAGVADIRRPRDREIRRMDELLKLLKNNALESVENLARMLDLSEDEVKKRIADYEKQGVIRGYQAIVNEEQLDIDRVMAVIEVKVLPEREGGFDHIAHRISKFPEVESAYLMSGTSDLLLFVSGKNLREVASFVSERLSTIEGVTATSTAFMLKAYKYNGIMMEGQDEYERLKVSP